MRWARISAVLVAAGLPFWPLPPRADADAIFSPAFHACAERSQGVTASMRACMFTEQQRLDYALDAAYRSLMAMMSNPAARAALADSERAWMLHRQSQCAFEGTQQAEGSLRPMLVSGCWLRETAQRLAELEQRRAFESRWRER